MSQINVVVAATAPDVKAEVIAESVDARPDMTLVRGRAVAAADVDGILPSLPATPQCAIVLVGRPAETSVMADRWLALRADLVVMLVDVLEDIVRIAVRDPRLDSLLSALRGLVERVGAAGQERVARIQLRAVRAVEPGISDSEPPPAQRRPLQAACIDWLHARLRDAVERVPDDNGDVPGLSLTKATLLQSLDTAAERPAGGQPRELADTDTTLDAALAAADPKIEPLAAAARTFALSPLEFRMLVLALAPELDVRFQRCIGFLLDEIGRRVGTYGLYSALLGATTRVRGELAQGGALSRWLVFEDAAGRQPAADEPLRVDPFLVRWLLGDRDALASDPRVRRAIRLVPWPGAALLERHEERASAAHLVASLAAPEAAPWILLNGDDPAAWRALLELGATVHHVAPVRVDASRLASIDIIEIEDCARRLGRLTRLIGDPLVIDATVVPDAEAQRDGLRLFFAALASTGCRSAVICVSEAALVRLIGPAPFELADGPALDMAARVAAVRTAAASADAFVTEDEATEIANRYPVAIDGLEHATRLARSRQKDYDARDPALARFAAACKEVAAEGLSHLAQRIEPVFNLDHVVLPPDRHQQLVEIVDHVRLAPRVLDGWRFRDLLPYGRGVTALFFGASGTGKTMAAIGIAQRLGVQILRVDLSKVMSKYIGDTEKHIDGVFTEAERSGSAILIDEAEALTAKRSEVKDAHDRYANIEVAYLLQRMEAYQGLAILTTNMRQALDPAFLRRLRFIIEFPRPTADARERIWRQCLPAGSHVLDDAAFRQLGRRLDVTGGHIRQIALRAAFIAAAAGTQIDLSHLTHAATAELAKLGMPAVQLDPAAGRQAA